MAEFISSKHDESGLSTVVFSVGSNLGDRLENLKGAVSALAKTPGIDLEAVSPVYETDPVGPVPQPDFLNLVVLGRTALAPEELLRIGLAIEQRFGRVRDIPKGPRTLDVDLIMVGEQRRQTSELTLPHPAASGRPFVVLPWLRIAPGAVLPGHGPLRELAAAMDSASVRERPEWSAW